MMRSTESPDAHTVKPSSHQRLHLCKFSQRKPIPPRIAVPTTAELTVSRQTTVPFARLDSSPVSITAIDLLRDVARTVSHYVACLRHSVAVPMKQSKPPHLDHLL